MRAQGIQDAVVRFDEGNRLFREGDFEGAIERYRQAEATGFASGALYYNTGNAYFRLNDVGQAIRYYEKARRWIPDRPELVHNLSVARARTVDSFSRLPAPFWRPAWEGMVRLFSPTGLFLLGFVFYVMALGAAAVRIRRGRSPWLRRSMLAGGVLAACFLFFGLAASFERARSTRAVVLHDQVTLLDRPEGTGGDVLVHEGTIVDVLATRSDWSEVRLPNGARGWMPADAYGTI